MKNNEGEDGKRGRMKIRFRSNLISDANDKNSFIKF